MPKYQHWRLEDQERIATLSLNRPEFSNSFNPEVFFELREITHHLSANKDVWAIIVQGNGAHFSIGIDVNVIGQMINLEKALFRKTLLEMQESLDAFEVLEKPTIAKIHGFCLGAGMILALCCDFRIASRRTVFGFPEVKRGVPVIMGAHRAVRVLGIGLAKEIMLLGRNIRAHTALSCGLVHQVVEPQDLDDKVFRLARNFLKLPPKTIGATKRIINQGHHLSIRASQDLEIDAQAELLNSPDFIEAITSHLENRSPKFIGE
jgi:enoyl-CoA hydratase/carnithine racemase